MMQNKGEGRKRIAELTGGGAPAPGGPAGGPPGYAWYCCCCCPGYVTLVNVCCQKALRDVHSQPVRLVEEDIGLLPHLLRPSCLPTGAPVRIASNAQR